MNAKIRPVLAQKLEAEMNFSNVPIRLQKKKKLSYWPSTLLKALSHISNLALSDMVCSKIDCKHPLIVSSVVASNQKNG